MKQQQLAQQVQREVQIPAAQATLTGNLVVPAEADGIVLFAHGSGSSRHSPRNVFVATELQRAGLGTLLFDLLTRAEEETDLYTREHRFDIALLAERLVHATHWIDTQGDLHALRLGYFGASTGSAAALVAASRLGERVSAVISRGGRPDLAHAEILARVKAPTLLIIGGDDDVVLEVNRNAYEHLSCEKRLTVVPGASHLFEEPGTLEAVARLACEWFRRHLGEHVSSP